MSEEEIIIGLRNGGPSQVAALRALYSSLGKRMLNFFVLQGATGEEAKDILQETFLKILRGADTLRGEAARPWIWQVARNCMNDFFRGKKRVSTAELVVDQQQLQSMGAIDQDTDARHQQLGADECFSQGFELFSAAMPERALALSLQLDGLSIEAIGDQIGRTATAAKTFLCECRKKLRPYVERCAELLTP